MVLEEVTIKISLSFAPPSSLTAEFSLTDEVKEQEKSLAIISHFQS